jgi:two-component sensor histidine kinase
LFHSLCGFSQGGSYINDAVKLNINKILESKNIENLSVTEILEQTELSINKVGMITIPPNATELEKAIFTTRRIQHNDSQLVAIKYLKTLLDFECYRNEGEKLYLKYLLASSLYWIGAPLVANSYINEVFPKLLSYIDDESIKGHLIGYYAIFMIRQDSLEKASDLYANNLDRYEKLGDLKKIYSTRNNLGYVYYLLKNYEDAKTLYRANQISDFKEVNLTLHAYSFGNYGSILQDEMQYDSALYYFNKEISLLKKYNIEEGFMEINKSLAKAYEAIGDPDSALYYYNNSILFAEKQRNFKAVVDGLEGLLRIYSSQSNNSWIKNTLEKYYLFNDSLKNEVSMKASRDEVQVSRFLEILADAERARKTNEQLESKNRELLFTTFFLVVIVVLLIFLITLRNKNRKKMELKNIQLEKNNSALENSHLIISESYNKNELLLKELHHRVKNNLQIISSLFSLQLNAKNLDVKTAEVFQDARNRIHSISLIHKKLYQSNNFENLEFKAYLEALSDDIIASQVNKVSVSIKVDCPPISIETAIPLGLIFNELLTNSLKHSMNSDSLEVAIEFENKKDHGCFIYSDNGIGVHDIEMMTEKEESIGVTLIHLLAEQLDATIEYQESSPENKGFWISLSGHFS